MTMAAERTTERRPSVRAFHVFNAIRAIAMGMKVVALILSPTRNGTITFFINPLSEKKKKLMKLVIRLLYFGRNVAIDQRIRELFSWYRGVWHLTQILQKQGF